MHKSVSAIMLGPQKLEEKCSLCFTGERGYKSAIPREETNVEMSTVAYLQQNRKRQRDRERETEKKTEKETEEETERKAQTQQKDNQV